MTGRLGHNGGPALHEPADTRPGRCKHCRHWKVPSDEEQRALDDAAARDGADALTGWAF